MPAFRLKVAASDVGKSFDLTYYRDGKEQTTTITPAPAENVVFDLEREQEPEKPSEQRSPSRPRPRSATSAWKSSR